jgi:hypothetical protein
MGSFDFEDGSLHEPSATLRMTRRADKKRGAEAPLSETNRGDVLLNRLRRWGKSCLLDCKILS